jgi:hypothetical protein
MTARDFKAGRDRALLLLDFLDDDGGRMPATLWPSKKCLAST